ncbi:MAG: 4Fe-4S binding protein [Clostridia bacterium]
MARKRLITQLLVTITTNSYLKGFIDGKIFQGKTKNICVPGLNCYSCPGAIGSCPIGSLQAVINSARYKISYYVIGLIALFGVIFGRFVCGWLCPFGWIQELIYKTPLKKVRWDKKLRLTKYLKYVILIVFVLWLPSLVNEFGVASPTFCEYICPAGTLEASLPLLATNSPLREIIGGLFYWKLSILVTLIFLSMILYRPFCYAVCPLGAIYSVFNKISYYQIKVEHQMCVECKVCQQVCKYDIYAVYDPNSSECIRCGDCVEACPTGALKMGFGFKKDK